MNNPGFFNRKIHDNKTTRNKPKLLIMFILANILVGIARFLDIFLTLLYWLIIIRALLSWVHPDPHNPIVKFLYNTTEPVLYPIRKILPLDFRFGIDVSAIIAFLLIVFLKNFLVKSLIDIAVRLK